MNEFVVIDNIYSLCEDNLLRVKVTCIKSTGEIPVVTTYAIIADSTKLLCQKIEVILQCDREVTVIMADPYGFSIAIVDWLIKNHYKVVSAKVDNTDVLDWKMRTSLAETE